MKGSLPPGVASPNSRFATASPPFVPGYQMSRIAGTCSAAQPRSSGKDGHSSRAAPPAYRWPRRLRAAPAAGPRRREQRRDATSPIMSCHSPTTTTATSAPAGDIDERCNSTVSSKPSGSAAFVRSSASTGDGWRRHHDGRAPSVHGAPAPHRPPSPNALDHAHRLAQVDRVRTPTGRGGRARESASGPMTAIERRLPTSKRQQRPFVAQQHCRPFGHHSHDLAVRWIGEHFRSPLLIQHTARRTGPSAPSR